MVSVLGFFDGSLSSKRDGFIDVCGFVATAETWVVLDQRWNAVLEKACWRSRLRELHMTKCVNRTEEFESWSFPERLALVGDLCTALLETPDIYALGAGIFCDCYHGLSASDQGLLEKEHLGKHRELVFRICLEQAVTCVKAHWPREQVAIIFDEEPIDNAVLYLAVHSYYQNSEKFGPYLSGIGFAKSASFTSIQAADLLAYGSYQWAMKQRYPDFDEPYFPVNSVFERLIKSVPSDGLFYNSDSIRKLLLEVRSQHHK